MSTILHSPEPRPELERRQSLDIPFDDEVSSIIGDVSSRIEEVTTAVGDEVSSRTELNCDTSEAPDRLHEVPKYELQG